MTCKHNFCHADASMYWNVEYELAATVVLMQPNNYYAMQQRIYRTDRNVGRIVNRVATFRNIANDLLRTLMIKNLIEYF